MRIKSYEHLLLFHCAPTLYGVKSANLFSSGPMAQEELDALIRSYSSILAPHGINIDVLCQCDSHTLFYIYNEQLLMRKLSAPAVKRFLSGRGWSAMPDCISLLSELKRRICTEGFPHEIGLFLDYPLGDVIGFIENSGQNFLCNGCWKVYENKEAAQALFRCYDLCREDACRKYLAGQSLGDILESKGICA